MLGIYADEDTDGEKAAPEKKNAEVVPQAVPSNGDMSYDEALCETTSDGQPYGELSNAQLANRSIGIDRGLKGNVTNEKQEELIRKLTAIKVILKNDPDEKRFVKATQAG